MKVLSISFVLLLLVSCKKEGAKLVQVDNGVSEDIIENKTFNDCGYHPSDDLYDDWNLVFKEDFDHDLSNWNAWESGAFNEELQYYQSENIELKDGYLLINAKREKTTGATDPFNNDIKEFEFTSGRIESKELFGPEGTEGKEVVRFSARLRLVEAHGIWPAWWSYNDPWPTQGEIDILEARGNKPYEFQSCFHYGAEINTLETDAKFNEAHYKHPEKLTECFHLYELEWSEDYFKIFFDGELVKTYDVANYEYVDDFFGHAHKLVLNVAVGGWFFESYDAEQIPNLSTMAVDWVRVYQK